MNPGQVAALVVIGLLDLSCRQLSAPRGDPSDFQAYMTEVRKLGMTESASGDLSMVANIRTGGSLLIFPKDEITGAYGRSYQGTACPIPGADPEVTRQWQAEVQKRVERDMEILRKHADRDGSGFISTVEGREFRDLVEFGYLAAHIAESDAASATDVARAARLTAEQVEERVAQYNAVARRLNELSQFKIPLVELTAPGARASGPGA